MDAMEWNGDQATAPNGDTLAVSVRAGGPNATTSVYDCTDAFTHYAVWEVVRNGVPIGRGEVGLADHDAGMARARRLAEDAWATRAAS